MRRSRLSRLGGLTKSFTTIGLLVVVLAAVLTVVFVAVGAAASYAYDQYGYHFERNTVTWALRTPVYAMPTTCRACHVAEQATVAAAAHSVVACEACHGPLDAHVAAGAAADSASVPVPRPPSETCVTCHEKVEGRPADMPQVDLAVHYSTASCLQCHDAHTAVAEPPPLVPHPLANLPACTVCHGFEGLNPMPRTHQDSADDVCLGCHKPQGAGS